MQISDCVSYSEGDCHVHDGKYVLTRDGELQDGLSIQASAQDSQTKDSHERIAKYHDCL